VESFRQPEVVVANNSGEAQVELGQCNNQGVCTSWWDKVILDFQLKTDICFWDQNDDGVDPLRSPIELFPGSQVEDRLTNLTVQGDPYIVRVLGGLKKVSDFYATEYGFRPPGIRVYGIPQPDAYFGVNGMAVGTDSLDFPPPYESVLAHEYAHAIQDYSVDAILQVAPCCPNECSHYQCNPPCEAGPFLEGMAGGMAEYYLRKTSGNLGYDFHQNVCGAGVGDEYSIAHFVYLMSTADPRAFLATYRGTRGIHLDPYLTYWPLPATMSNYWHAWRGEDDPGLYDISVFRPGTFNATAFYQLAIMHTITGVEEAGNGGGESVVVLNAVGKGPFLVRMRTGQSGQGELCVFDVRGRLRTRAVIHLDKDTEHTHVLDLSSAPAGIYFLRAEIPGASRKRVVGRIVNVK
jgi:hypothetical protein